MAKECDSKTCDKTSCEGCSSKKNPQSMQAAMNASSNVKHVIGIVSGKGWCWQILCYSFSGKPDGKERLQGRYPGC